MSYLSANDIYFHTQLKKRVSLNPRYLNENFEQFIEKIIKNNIEGKCIKEGYVVPNTVVILKRSMGNLNTNQFNGNILFDVTVGAKICNIPVNSVIKAKVKKINKLGILAELGPLMIIVPKEIHQAKEPFKEIKPGHDIELLVIGKTFDLNSRVISVYAKLNSEVKRKVVIPVRKIVHKNTNKFLADETIMPEEENYEETTKESEESIERLEEDSGTELEDSDAEEVVEDYSDVEDDVGPEELDIENVDDEESLEAADELVVEENEMFSDDSDEEEEDEEEIDGDEEFE